MLFGKWSGTEVKIDGEDLIIMKESDIMGVLGLIGRISPYTLPLDSSTIRREEYRTWLPRT